MAHDNSTFDSEQIAEQDKNLRDLIDNYDDYVDGLLDGYTIKRKPSKAQKAKIIKIAESTKHDLPDIETIIKKHFPALVSEDEKENDAYFDALHSAKQSRIAEIVQRKKYKVDRRASDEPPATQKQIDYLQSLGVGKKININSLGKKQASQLIEQAVEARDEAYESTRDFTIPMGDYRTPSSNRKKLTSRKKSNNDSISCLGMIIVFGVFILILAAIFGE